MKKFILLSIFLLVVVSGCNNEQNNKTSNIKFDLTQKENINSGDDKKNISADKIEIVLFHGNYRCYSCNKMEELIEKTLFENYKKEVENGKIQFFKINGELPSNIEMVKKYKATGLSIFINSIISGKDNINEETNAWRFINDENKFKNYFFDKLNNL